MLEIMSRVLIGEGKKREDEEHYLPIAEYTFPEQKVGMTGFYYVKK
jgi:hypothetical protein